MAQIDQPGRKPTRQATLGIRTGQIWSAGQERKRLSAQPLLLPSCVRVRSGLRQSGRIDSVAVAQKEGGRRAREEPAPLLTRCSKTTLAGAGL